MRHGVPGSPPLTHGAELASIPELGAAALRQGSQHDLSLEVCTQISSFLSHCEKNGPPWFEAIAFRWHVLSVGDSGSPSQLAVDNKMVHNPRECLCLFPALHVPKSGAVPRGVRFPTAVDQAPHCQGLAEAARTGLAK